MEEIQRPSNVYVPRHVRLRIQASRALESGKKADLQEVVDEFGLEVPKGSSNVDGLREVLAQAVGAANYGGGGTATATAGGNTATGGA